MAKKYQFIDINGMKKFLVKINEKYSTKTEVTQKVETVDQKVTNINQKLTSVEEGVSSTNQKISNVEQSVTSMDQKINESNAEITVIKNQTSNLDKINTIESKLTEALDKTTTLEQRHTEFTQSLESVSQKISATESKIDNYLPEEKRLALDNSAASVKNKFVVQTEVGNMIDECKRYSRNEAEGIVSRYLPEEIKTALESSGASSTNNFLTKNDIAQISSSITLPQHSVMFYSATEHPITVSGIYKLIVIGGGGGGAQGGFKPIGDDAEAGVSTVVTYIDNRYEALGGKAGYPNNAPGHGADGPWIIDNTGDAEPGEITEGVSGGNAGRGYGAGGGGGGGSVGDSTVGGGGGSGSMIEANIYMSKNTVLSIKNVGRGGRGAQGELGGDMQMCGGGGNGASGIVILTLVAAVKN